VDGAHSRVGETRAEEHAHRAWPEHGDDLVGDVDDVEPVECARERLDERRDLRGDRAWDGWRLMRAMRAGTTISSA
jgi:hypothetical protein